MRSGRNVDASVATVARAKESLSIWRAKASLALDQFKMIRLLALRCINFHPMLSED
jgi:hypothetical protein